MQAVHLKSVVNETYARIKIIKDSYPGISCYPVFSLSAGQCELTADLKVIIKYFPDMLVESEDKAQAVKIFQVISGLKTKIKELEAKGKESVAKRNQIHSLTNQLQDQLPDFNKYIEHLDVREGIFIELRFENTLLEEIFRLQSDTIVSQRYTPHTNASVRIVLGTIAELYEGHVRQKK